MFNFISHATVIHCIKTAESLKETDAAFAEAFFKVEAKVEQTPVTEK